MEIFSLDVYWWAKGGNDLPDGSTENSDYSEVLGVSRRTKACKSGRYNDTSSYTTIRALHPCTHRSVLPSPNTSPATSLPPHPPPFLSNLADHLTVPSVGRLHGPLFLPLRCLHFNHNLHTRHPRAYPAQMPLPVRHGNINTCHSVKHLSPTNFTQRRK